MEAALGVHTEPFGPVVGTSQGLRKKNYTKETGDLDWLPGTSKSGRFPNLLPFRNAEISHSYQVFQDEMPSFAFHEGQG